MQDLRFLEAPASERMEFAASRSQNQVKVVHLLRCQTGFESKKAEIVPRTGALSAVVNLITNVCNG